MNPKGLSRILKTLSDLIKPKLLYLIKFRLPLFACELKELICSFKF